MSELVVDLRREPRTWVKFFDARFRELVRGGHKMRTIRSGSDDVPAVGDIISCRCWAGQQFTSNQDVLFVGRITRSDWIAIEQVRGRGVRLQEGKRLTVPGAAAADAYLDAFARADGFDSWAAAVEWFRGRYGLPFFGYLIEWEAL